MADVAVIELTFLARVVIAGLLASILGWERQHAKKPAGLRTHIIVGIAAALYTAISEITFVQSGGMATGGRSDPLRVIQAVAVGIGFLGSGIIMVSGTGANRDIRGLTTAASVWATAAIGMATAMGHYVLAIGSTLLLFFVLRILGRFEGGHGGD